MRKMKKLLASGLLCGALLTASIGGAAAGQIELGTPGEANCEGQSRAAVAQAVKNFENAGGELPEEIRRGFANFAKLSGASNQELQQAVQEFCAEEPS